MADPRQKGNFLSRIKSALLFGSDSETSTKVSKEVNKESAAFLDEIFANAFSNAGGKFAYCISEDELCDELQLIFQDSSWKHIFCADPALVAILSKAGIPSKNLIGLGDCQATLTRCESLLADSGKIVMSARVDKSRQLKACPAIQLVVAYTDQIRSNEADAIQSMTKKYGDDKPASITLLSPPEKAKESDKALIHEGANEPEELYVFLLESKNV